MKLDPVGWFVAVWTINKRLKANDRKLADLMKIQQRLFEVLIQNTLAGQGDNQRLTFVTQLQGLNRDFMEAALEREVEAGNPLTHEEALRLQSYWRRVDTWKLGQALPLTADEARDFNALAKRLKEDRASKGEFDWGAIVLAGVALLLLSVLVKEE